MANSSSSGADYSNLVALVQKPSQASGTPSAQNSQPSSQTQSQSQSKAQQKVSEETAEVTGDLSTMYELNRELMTGEQMQKDAGEFWDRIDEFQADLEAKGLSQEDVKKAVDYMANLFKQGRLIVADNG
jgi:type VI protein secretion system component VasF